MLRSRWNGFLSATGLFCLLMAGTAGAELHLGFDSAQVSWRLADADCGIRIAEHNRDFVNFHRGGGSEHLQLVTGQGTYAYLIHEVPSAPVIAEWSPRLWVKSDRGGLQLMARVVLPRAADPQTGKPMTVLLRGESYNQVGVWQQLRIAAADQALEREVRILRSHFGPNVDSHEAFVDLIVLNAYGGLGATNVWIDELVISGHVDAMRFSSHATTDPRQDGTTPPDHRGVRSESPAGQRSAAVNGSVTLAEGRPLFPRIIEYNGEPFDQLKSLGFNTIKLAAAPTSIQLREAERLDLWIVAPPPNDLRVTPAHDRVLAWHVGRRLAAGQLELTRQWAGDLRRADLRGERPLVGESIERVWSYSRLLDVLELDRSPLGSACSLSDYGQWVEQRPTLARPGTPHWATIQTEAAPELVNQWMAMGLGTPMSTTAEQEQIRLLAFQAIASGVRGLVFKSRTPLDNGDNDAQARARAVHRLNIELDLIEPWISGGSRASQLPPPAPDARVTVLQTARSQLLIITDGSTQQQYTAGGTVSEQLSLVVPGAATAPQVYTLTPGGLKSVGQRRVAGGIRINIQNRDRISLIAITQEPLVIAHLARTLARHTVAAAKLQYELASNEFELVEMVHSRLVGQTPADMPSEQWLGRARDNLRYCEAMLGGSDYAAAHLFAEKSINHLGQVRRTHWERAVRDFPSPVASPYCVSFSAILLHWEMARRLQATDAWSPNQLPAGDFESLEHMRNTGWQNLSVNEGNVRASAELSPAAPRAGGVSLRLLATASDPGEPPVTLEGPAVQIISPPIRMRQGQVARIQGWVRIPQQIQRSQDGLMIYDSFAGPALAERVPVTDGWREFVLYRAAPADGELSLTFALTGFGQAYIDDVNISVHDSIADRFPGNAAEQAQRLSPAPNLVR